MQILTQLLKVKIEWILKRTSLIYSAFIRFSVPDLIFLSPKLSVAALGSSCQSTINDLIFCLNVSKIKLPFIWVNGVLIITNSSVAWKCILHAVVLFWKGNDSLKSVMSDQTPPNLALVKMLQSCVLKGYI